MKLPWYAPLALAGALALSVYSCQRAEREKGATKVLLAQSEAVGDSLRARRAVVDTVYRTQTRTLTRTLATVDTLRDSLTITDTVEVVRFIAAQDSAIVACQRVVLTCEARVALADSLTANVTHQLVLTRRLVNQPRTAIGLAWDARGGLGVAGDRDWSRFRVGASVTPNGAVARLSIWW